MLLLNQKLSRRPTEKSYPIQIPWGSQDTDVLYPDQKCA